MTKKLSPAQRRVVEAMMLGRRIMYSLPPDASAFMRSDVCGAIKTVHLKTFWSLRDMGLLVKRELAWHSHEYTLNRAAAEEVMK